MKLIWFLVYALLAPAATAEEVEAQGKMSTEELQTDTHALTAEEQKMRSRVSKVRAMSNMEICASKGAMLRQPDNFYDYEAKEINFQYAKRKLQLNPKQVRNEEFTVGSTECTVFAVYGLPTNSNRSVGAWGERIQHVYRDRGVYVYVRNGIVESWQD